jgi:hypothetical protein
MKASRRMTRRRLHFRRLRVTGQCARVSTPVDSPFCQSKIPSPRQVVFYRAGVYWNMSKGFVTSRKRSVASERPNRRSAATSNALFQRDDCGREMFVDVADRVSCEHQEPEIIPPMPPGTWQPELRRCLARSRHVWRMRQASMNSQIVQERQWSRFTTDLLIQAFQLLLQVVCLR